MRKRSPPITAEELMAQLNADPEFVAARAREDEELDKREAEFALAEAPLVAELRTAGFQVTSAWDLVNTRDSYPKAVPILLAHLTQPYPAAVREGIARALCVPDANYAWSTLVQLYRDEPDHRVKDGIAVALCGAATECQIGDLVELTRETALGASRIFFLWNLERSADPRAKAALTSLATDPDLTLEIQEIQKRRTRNAIRRVQRALAKSPKPAKRTKGATR